MNIRKHLFKNERFHKSILQQIHRFLIRPYVRWRNVPIIAITGSNGKTTTIRLLNRIYVSAGYKVGMCCTDGVYYNGALIAEGDYSYGTGVWKATRARDIDIVLAETARGGILKYGLGFSECQVGVVTNVYEDHLGFEGINTVDQMAVVKSTIPRHTISEGTVVLNGDLKLVRQMAANTQASVIYFTVEGRQDEFENCYYLNASKIYGKTGSVTEVIIDANTIPFTHQGLLTYNIANAAAALATVKGMQPWAPVPFKTVKTVLQEFGRDPHDILARFSMLRYKGNTVLLCRCKNPEGFRRNVEVIRKIHEKYEFDHVIGILNIRGALREIDYRKITRMVVPICQHLFIRPPKEKYWHLKTGEEIVSLICAGVPRDHILSTENLPLESVVERTKQAVQGNILYVYFNALYESTLDLSKVINEGKIIPINFDK